MGAYARPCCLTKAGAAKDHRMEEQHAASLVLFCATLPVTIDPYYSDSEWLLAMAPLGQGMFIMDEDRCYPALLQMIQHWQSFFR